MTLRSLVERFRLLPHLECLDARNLPSFLPPVSYPVGVTAQAVEIADLNADGILDFVAANATSRNVSVYLGNGDGTFRPSGVYPTGNGATWPAAGDFDNDGLLDLAVTNRNPNTVSILRGNGDGTFRSPVNYSGFADPIGIVADDFNGDGNLDFAVGNYRTNSVTVMLGNGSLFFEVSSYSVGSNPNQLIRSDLNADGTSDLVTANQGSTTVSVLLGNGDGTFQDAVHYNTGPNPVSVQAGDIDGDGVLDLLAVNAGSIFVSLLRGNGDGTFGPAANTFVGGGAWVMALADFDQDGLLDFALGQQGSGIYRNFILVMLNNGDGTFRPQTYHAGVEPYGVWAGDFNNDGYTDLAVSASGDRAISILMNSGDWSGSSPGQGSGSSPSAQTHLALLADGSVLRALSSQKSWWHCFGPEHHHNRAPAPILAVNVFSELPSGGLSRGNNASLVTKSEGSYSDILVDSAPSVLAVEFLFGSEE